MTRETQFVPFRLIQCPDCATMLCWVNPRFPNYCPECGKYIFDKVKFCILQADRNASLTYDVD